MSIPTMVRGEIWRVSRHRISRVFVGVMLITVTGLMVFQTFTHSQDVDAALHQAELERDQVVSSEVVDDDLAAELPVSAFYHEPRYLWAFDARNDAQTTAIIATVLAFMWGIILSGSGWVMGTNRHVFTWEPRRAPLLATRAVAIAGYAALIYLIAAAIMLAGSVVAAATRGSFASVSPELILSTLSITLRGAAAVALFAVVGSLLADLVRSPIPPLVAMAGYLVLVEPGIRAAYPGASDRLVTSLVLGWIKGRFVEGRTITIDCGLTDCPDALHFTTAPGPGLALALIGVLLFAAMWLTVERRDVTT